MLTSHFQLTRGTAEEPFGAVSEAKSYPEEPFSLAATQLTAAHYCPPVLYP